MTKSELPVDGCVSQALLLKKQCYADKLKHHNCNPFQSSSSLTIRASFCVYCFIYTSFYLFWRLSLASPSEPAQLFERVSDVTHILAVKEFARHAQYGSFILWRHLCIPPDCTPFQPARVGGRKFKEVLSKDFFLVLIAYIGYGSCTTMPSMIFVFEKESKAC